MKKKVLPGVNIQFPISRLILEGEKSVETRTYSLPEKYIGIDMAMIETPGKAGAFKARVVAIIRFGEPFKYASKREFRQDVKRHCVSAGSTWDWSDKAKWGWPVRVIKRLEKPKPFDGRKGIRFTASLEL